MEHEAYVLMTKLTNHIKTILVIHMEIQVLGIAVCPNY